MEKQNKWIRTIGSPNTVENLLKRALAACNEDPSDLCMLPQLEKVQKYREAVEYLVAAGVPFHEIPDLVCLIQCIIMHTQVNRESLLETGYPESALPESRWLNGLLGLHLPTKMPLLRSIAELIMGNPVDPEEIDEEKYDFVWVREPGTARSFFVEARAFRKTSLTLCSHQDAALLEELSPDDTPRLEALRPKLFNVKIGILKEAQTVLKNMDVEHFFENCVSIIKRCLTPDEISFISRMDDFYLAYTKQCLPNDPQTFWVRFYGRGICYSGFLSLFKFIGHVIKEVKFRSFDNFAGALLIWENELSEHPKKETEYQVPWGPNIEMIVKLSKRVEEDEKAFWKQFPGEIQKALFEEAAK